MYLILIGAPGSGKGTQGQKLSEYYKIPQISTGAMFREAIERRTSVGLKVKEYMGSGKLIPNEFVLEITKERLNQQDCKKGCILDGVPRTITQAENLEKVFFQKQLKLIKALHIIVSEEKLIERAIGRRFCKICQTTYHILFNPPKIEGVCNLDSGKLFQRYDDKEETIKNRILEYRNLTYPLVDYYKKKNIYYALNGLQSIDKVFLDILSVLK